MAHVIGVVNDIAELITAIRDACTANGWSLTGDILHRGNVHVRLSITSGVNLRLEGGTGIGGSGELTGGPTDGGVGYIRVLNGILTYPMTYEVHINTGPDEVYVYVNYSGEYYQWAAWGQSTVTGLLGSGVWFGASAHPSGNANSITMQGADAASNGNSYPALFSTMQDSGGTNNCQNCYVDHGLDGSQWNPLNVDEGATAGGIRGHGFLWPMLQILPNTWNNETVLLPAQGWLTRLGGTLSLVVDLAHARHCRIDFHEPGDIITLGTDKWKLYPCYRKNIVVRNGGFNTDHTGTYGHAIRYTGA